MFHNSTFLQVAFFFFLRTSIPSFIKLHLEFIFFFFSANCSRFSNEKEVNNTSEQMANGSGHDGVEYWKKNYDCNVKSVITIIQSIIVKRLN